MTPRLVYLATADARGHLMRAQLLVHALRRTGARVDVLTTSHAGQRFLADFGIAATILSQHYAMQFDSCQNMLRSASNRNVFRYIADPARMLRDMLRLHRALRDAHFLINDSFHPAALFMGMLPPWRRKVLHVYGVSLREAVLSNFDGEHPGLFGRLFRRVVAWQIGAAGACIEHDFAYDIAETTSRTLYRLPTPVALVQAPPVVAISNTAAVYLNPHFRDVALADALCAGIADAGMAAHPVGEGYAGHGNWLSVDVDWPSHAARAPVIVSAPGMAALSIALVYGRPIVLVLTEQPEQVSNAQRALQLRVPHKVVTWRGDVADFRRQVAQAATDLTDAGPAAASLSLGRVRAQARIDAWTDRLLALCEGQAQT